MKKLLVFLLIPFLNIKVIAQCNENQFEIYVQLLVMGRKIVGQ